jgi:hypothetical protein
VVLAKRLHHAALVLVEVGNRLLGSVCLANRARAHRDDLIRRLAAGIDL